MIGMTEKKINSNDYWDERFDTDWEVYNGQAQTTFFINLLIDHLPTWLQNDLKTNEVLICDAGCAEGQGTNLFKKQFPKIRIEGIDFSEVAINKAKEMYPELSFKKDDIYQLENDYEVIFVSNVLEHFEEPFTLIKNLLNKAQQHLIIMVPFQEVERLKEHFFTFDYKNFPIKMNDFTMSYFKEIDCRLLENSHWNGKQAIIIYTKDSLFNLNMHLDSIDLNKDDENYSHQVDEKLKTLTNKIETLSNWGTSLQQEVENRDSIITEQNKKLDELSNWGTSLQQEIENRDSIIIEQNKKLEELSNWGTSLQQEVENRDSTINELNKKLNEISEWGVSLENEVKQRDKTILEQNSKIEAISQKAQNK
jgi:O-antigen biosynthesis protein